MNTENGLNIIQHLSKERNKPLISIVVMTYKNQEGIYRTLETIISQEYPNIELIVSDDASGKQDANSITDYIERCKKENLKSLQILCNKENLGTVKHANEVLKYCHGKYIKFLPCGDGFVDPNSLNLLYEFISYGGYKIATSKAIVCNENFSDFFYEFPNSRRVKLINDSNSQQLNSILKKINIISAIGTIFENGFFDKYKFDESYRYLEDWPLWLKITRENIKIPCLDVNIGYYSIGGLSSELGNAYNSNLLRLDMIKCYEKEILPFIDMENLFNKYVIINRYIKLKNYDKFNLIQKICFNIEYFPIETYYFLKNIAKKIILKKRGNEKSS